VLNEFAPNQLATAMIATGVAMSESAARPQPRQIARGKHQCRPFAARSTTC
jgi:hypothetical protein